MDELETYFEDETRAVEWRNLRHALLNRQRALKLALADTQQSVERSTLEKQISAINKQIDILRIEEAAQQFVEDSVRVTVNAHQLRDSMDTEK